MYHFPAVCILEFYSKYNGVDEWNKANPGKRGEGENSQQQRSSGKYFLPTNNKLGSVWRVPECRLAATRFQVLWIPWISRAGQLWTVGLPRLPTIVFIDFEKNRV